MDIKQLEYFVAACEHGNISNAAKCLYTSQSYVSKVISSLEQELGRKLFVRCSHGIRLTPYGQTVREYALRILKDKSTILSLAVPAAESRLAISTYPSNMLAQHLIDFYRTYDQSVTIEHYEGTVEEVTDYVKCGISEFGIIFIAHNQLKTFQHILSHKGLEYTELAVKDACIYVGKHHPLYGQERISFQDLASIKFIGTARDYFSVEHHLAQISIGEERLSKLNYVAFSNSDHVVINALLKTDLASLGINYMYDPYRRYDISEIVIESEKPYLSIGYVSATGQNLSDPAQWFIDRVSATLEA